MAVATGNENQDCRNVSPASAAYVYTVAASDKTDTNAGTNGLIKNNPSGTVNKMLFKYVTAW